MSLDAKKAAFILRNGSRFNASIAETKHFTRLDPSLSRSAQNLRTLRQQLLAISSLSAQERKIIYLIQEHTIFQTASRDLRELYRAQTPLKSVAKRTLTSDSMNNIRTPNYHGRRHYNYFVAGVGIHPNTRSLRTEPTAYIKFRHLSQKNPLFLRYFFMSPHLSDLEHSRQWGPIILAETTLVIQFNKTSNSIQYRFSSHEGGEKSLTFHASELTFAGEHIAAALSQLFIVFLRLTDGNFQQHVYDALEKDEKTALSILADTMTAFMPGWMVAEVKATCDIPWEIVDAWSGDFDGSKIQTFLSTYIGDNLHYTPHFPLSVLNRTVEEKMDAYSEEIIKKIAATHEKFQKMYGDDKIEEISRFFKEASIEEKDLFILMVIRQFIDRVYDHDDRWLDAYSLLNHIAARIMTDSGYSDIVTPILDALLNMEFASNRKTVIKIKLNPNERDDKHGVDLFRLACELKDDRVDVLQCLIQHGGDMERFGLQYLTMAAAHGNNECVRYIATFKLDMHCKIKLDGNEDYLSNPLAIYVKDNNMEMLRYLLDHGFDPNFIPKSDKMAVTALDIALATDNREMILFLLERGASASNMAILSLILGNNDIRENLAAKKCFSLLFPTPPTAEDLEDYFIPEQSYVITASVAIVTGVDKQGEPFVILGKRKADLFKGSSKSDYTFPGGLRIPGETFSACATREAAEELGLPDLKSYIKEITCIYTYEDEFKYVKFYHIDVGDSLAEKPVYAQDDFLLARKVSFKNIHFKEDYQGVIKLPSGHLLLNRSTALLLRDLLFKGKVDATNNLIKIALLIEYEEILSKKLFIEKLKEGDLATLQAFVLLGFKITPSLVKEALIELYGSGENDERRETPNANDIIRFLMENLTLKANKQTHFDFFEGQEDERPCVLIKVWKLLQPDDITVDILECLIAYGFDAKKFFSINSYDKEEIMLNFIKNPSKTAVIQKIFSLGYPVSNPYELYISAVLYCEDQYKREVTDGHSAVKKNIELVRDHYKIEISKSLIDIFKYGRRSSKMELNRIKALLFEHKFCLEKLSASTDLDAAITTIIFRSLIEYKHKPFVQNMILDAFIELKFPIIDSSNLKREVSWCLRSLRAYGIDVSKIEEKVEKIVSVSARESLRL